MNEQLLEATDDRHVVLSIAVKPRDTIRYVLTTKKLSYFIIVGIIGVFASNLISFIGEDFTGQFSLGDIVYSTLLLSFLYYFLSTALSAGILTLSAKIFGGTGTFKEMFRMLSVTMIPYIWILPILLFWMQFAPQSFFNIAYIDTSLSDLILQFVCWTFVIIASLWTYMLTVVGISEVHRISIWTAFFASLLVVIVVVVLAGALVL